MKAHLKPAILLSLVFIMSCQNLPDDQFHSSGESFDVTGKIFRLDHQSRSFDLLKETAIDPRVNEGRSRYEIHWINQTEFTEVVEQNSFEGLNGSYTAYFYNLNKGKLDDANAKNAKSGEPFIALHATLLKDGEDTSAYGIGDSSVLGKFTPLESSPRFREGHIELDGKKVPVKLRGPRALIKIRKPIEVKEIASHGWEANLKISIEKNKWVAEKVDVTRRPDPREIDDPKLPRVLVIGDSISMNYHEAAKSALEGVANYYRNDGNAGPSDRGAQCVDLWLGDYEQPGLHWDVIQFNFGLHDLKQMYDESSKEYRAYQLPLSEYQANLKNVIEKLKKTGAKLVWCTTSPVPNSSTGKWGDKVMGRRKDEDLVFNKAALEVVSQYPDIAVSDINSFIRGSSSFDDWRKGSDVHFWGRDLQTLVGKAVADNLKNALKQK